MYIIQKLSFSIDNFSLIKIVYHLFIKILEKINII
jgi:hypothetical protein